MTLINLCQSVEETRGSPPLSSLLSLHPPMSYTIHSGNCLDHMRTEIAPASVHCVVTSPPYWGLRDYGIPGIDWLDGWHGVFGNEPTIFQYIAHTLEVFAALKRVLRPDGVIWWNMGDTYSQAEKWGGVTGGKHRRELHGTDARKAKKNDEVPNGNKLMIPYRVAIALQDAGWCVRQDIIWAKPSPMPESVSGWSWQRCKVKIGRVPVEHGGLSSWDMGDHTHGGSGAYRGEPKTIAKWSECPGCSKCNPHDGYVLRKGQWRPTTGHEVILQITQGGDYFCDATAAAEPTSGTSHVRPKTLPKSDRGCTVLEKQSARFRKHTSEVTSTRNPRSVWRFASESYKGAHFATYPTELPFRCITASTSQAGCCPTCGSQYAPVTSKERRPTRPGIDTKNHGRDSLEVGNRDPERHVTETVVSGYRPSCSCPVLPPIPATVYDPFGGSGTTVQVAHHMGRHGVCSELSGDYRGLAEARIAKRPKCLEPVKPPKKPRRVIHNQQRRLFATEVNE